MTELELIIDLHLDGDRQGPGSRAMTLKALGAAGLVGSGPVRVLDVGCGTGASTACLAGELQAEIVAVDLFPAFLEKLAQRAKDIGFAGRLSCMVASMDCLPVAESSFDLIWSEGAIYNIGFRRGLELWRPLLKPGGVIAVSELSWLTMERPDHIHEHWTREYPEVATAEEKIAILRDCGYELIDCFVLDESAWLDEYYGPLLERLDAFLDRHQASPEAEAIAAAERAEAELYDQYKASFGYCFYIARKSTC